jgi:hypothetical protein
MLRFEDLRVRDQQFLDRDFFNRRFRLIAESLAQIDAGLTTVTGATDRLVTLGLNRVNEVLGPALAQAQAAAASGFLVATSTTPLMLTVGLETTLAIDDTPARPLFAPTPYVILSRQADDALDDWAMLRVQTYDRGNGGLAFAVVAVHGELPEAVHDDWVVSASAGIAQTFLVVAGVVVTTLAAAEEAAATAEAAAATALQIIANGPVSSVNGQTGLVSIGMADIPNLVAAIGAKADSNHGHSIAQVSNLQTTLAGLQSQITNFDGGAY